MTQRFWHLRPSWRRALFTAALVLGISLYSLVLEPSAVGIVFSLVGGVLAAAALFGVPVQTASAGFLAAGYLASLFEADVALDPGVPLVALLLFGLNEALHNDGTTPEFVSPEARRTRVWSVAGVALAGSILGSVLLVVAAIFPTSGSAFVAAGGLVAVLIIAAVLRVTRPLLADPASESQDR